MQHTSHTLCLSPGDEDVMCVGMLQLAQQSETVLHAILAVSAAQIAWTMISASEPPAFEAVTQALLTGYRHYNLASEQMRQAILSPGSLDPQPLIATTLMLIPFATASQQLNHWLSSRTGSNESHKPLSSTPRDIIVIMRGVRTMLQSVENTESKTIVSQFLDLDMNSQLFDPSPSPTPSVPASSRTHFMTSIIATTSRAALATLQSRLDSALLHSQDCSYVSLLACAAAFENLKLICKTAFEPSTTADTSSLPSLSIPSSSISPSLHSLASQFYLPSSTPLSPTSALTRFFLSFYIQAPNEYLDVVLPLLDQRLEKPLPVPLTPQLTTTQALALDIYAHWSVLMILVEEESWWIGGLPGVTLEGMGNAFGWWVGEKGGWVGVGEGEWWPGKMLGIARDMGSYK